MSEGAHPGGDQRARRARADRHLLGLVAAAALGALSGCDVGVLTPAPPPPVTLLDIQVAQATDGGIPSGYTAIAADGSTAGVVAKTSFRVVFDRLLLPTTTFRQSVCLQPVLGLVRAAKDCTHGVALEPAYDPVRRQITYRQPATSAGLVPGTRYTFSVFPPDPGTTNGIAAFDGAPLDGAVSRDFTTRDAEPVGTMPDLPPSVDYCATLDHAVFQAACATASCHRGGSVDHGVTLGPAEGLDLASSARLRATALGHVAHETQTGEHADEAEASPARFGRAMPIIDPTRPGTSYLLYKLLANPANGAPGSDAAAEQRRLDELERLRSSVVVGLPMPPPDGKSAPITPQQLQEISDWILAGAKADCP